MDWGASGRRDTYWMTTVDPFSLVDTGDLEAIPQMCSITYGYYTDNFSSAKLTVPEYDGGMVRVYHGVELPDGTYAEECLGTFFVDSVEKRRSAGMEHKELACYSSLWRLSQDALASDFVAKAGTSCLTGLTAMITAEGAMVVVSPELAARVHSKDSRFKAGENRLSSVNTYAGNCGWKVGVDDYGYQTIEVYTPPRNRAVKYSFEAGETCVYVPNSDETFTGDVCNRVIARWSEEEIPSGFNVSSMRAVADLPGGNPLSFERCGRRITHVLDMDEPCAMTELVKVASDYLSEHDAAIRYFEIEHVGIPYLRPGDVVEYLDPENGDDAMRCEVTQMSVSTLAPLMMTKTKLKVIA